MKIRLGALSLVLCAAAWGQSAFEVATIKPAAAPTPAMIVSGKFHAGVRIDGSRVDMGFLTIRDLMASAYKVKEYQIAGPDWIASQHFDIVGKIPDGVGEDKVPEMLQSLLVERFGLKEHRDMREHEIYRLVQARGGAKLKESAEPAPAPPPADTPQDRNQTSFSVGLGDRQMNVTAGRGGAVITTSDGSKIHMGMGPDGTMQMQATRIPMVTLAEYLNRMVDRPVIDRTGLKGYYDINLDLAIADLIKAAASSGVIAPGMAEAAGRAGALPPGVAAAASDPAGGSIFTSIQKLGLRLEPAKEPIETIVVDHVEKLPTEN